MRTRRIHMWWICVMALNSPVLAQHAGDIWIGRSQEVPRPVVIDTTGGFDPVTSVVVLPPDDYGGWSLDEPGFDRITVDRPAEDLYVLEPGADIWLEVVSLDPALVVVVPPSFLILDGSGQETRLGDHTVHKHLIWWIDDLDPNFDPNQCVWQGTFVLKDEGSTSYAASEPFTLSFMTHDPIPGDCDCDTDVDIDDFAYYQGCVTGSSVPLTEEGCSLVDLDGDTDVDQADFGLFQRCLTGPDVPGDPDCADES